MQLGILIIDNRFLTKNIYKEIKNFIRQEFMTFFDYINFILCKNEITEIKKKLNEIKKYDTIFIIDNMRLENYDYNIEFYKNWLDRRIIPLEESLKYSLVQKFGPLTALSSQVAGIKDSCHVFAFSNKLDEIKQLIYMVIKTFILNHLIFKENYKKPLHMLKEYVEYE